jgi:two-component system, cell cycle sensor histidine kinase and response regulator CckA
MSRSKLQTTRGETQDPPATQVVEGEPKQAVKEAMLTEGLAPLLAEFVASKWAEAEAALRSSEKRYRRLFERSLVGIYRSTLNGRLLDLNEAYASVLGYSSRSEAMRHTLWDAAPDADGIRMMIAQVQEQKAVVNREVCLQRIDGKPVWVLASAALVEDDESGPSYIEGTFLDITEHKKLQQNLVQSQRIEAVVRLTGGIAHDLNNQLTAILGYSDLALESLPENSPTWRQVFQIRQAGDHAASLIRQLLAFSRLQVLDRQLLDLNRVVRDAERMLQRLIGERVDLVTSLDPSLRLVEADPVRIRQVIESLAQNACDAMPEGGRLSIATSNMEVDGVAAARLVGFRAGRYVVLAVTDTGCGMDPVTQGHIFEPFFTTKKNSKNIGLGLSAVFGVVKQSGGYVSLESSPGAGATFKVYLPCVEQEVTSTKSA